MKKFLLLFVLAGIMSGLQAQDTLSIQQIQNVPANDLQACIDTSFYLNDTVYTYGTVVMDGGLAQATSGRNIWIQNGTGPFSGLDVYDVIGGTVPGTDVLSLVQGDSVLIKGFITRFGRETEIAPLEITVLDVGKPVHVQPIDISDLNDNLQENQLETGEQWEGSYVEITDVTVTNVSFFSGNNRVSFIVSDAAGNLVNISDRFLVQRLPSNPAGTPGNFVPPTIGDQFDTIRGVVVHSANGCTNLNGRGYEIFPFQESDYVKSAGASSPLISNITRNPATPTSSQDANISATIEDTDGNVTGAQLHYAVGVSNTNYLSVPMTSSGSTYTGTIPNTAFSDGDFVKYYITATDNDNLTSTNPDINNNFNPLFFTVRDNGLTIFDVQFTPFENGSSGYQGQEVEVSGIVTASAGSDDLGFVYIQQRNQSAWAGLPVVQNAQLATLARGDSVIVRGTIQEDFGMTRMENIITVSVASSGNTLPEPVALDPSTFSSYDFQLNEAYEGMIVKLEKLGGGDLFVVDENADGPNNNFAEYRVGSDPFDPNNGSRVLAGRVTGSAFGSLAFSYVNDSSWATNSGQMTVSVCEVEVGDTLTSLTGIMYYSFGNMKLLPRNNDDMMGFAGANCKQGGTNLETELAGTELAVFPNPTADQLNVRFRFPKVVQGEAVLMDLMGREVRSLPLQTQEGTLEFATAGLSAGTYLLTLQVEGTPIAREKVMIVR
jgi:hypothetical protein